MSVSERTKTKWREPTMRLPLICLTDKIDMPKWHNPSRWEGELEHLGQFTYFIGWKGGPVKIGRAIRPWKRLADFQTGCPYRLHLWAAATQRVYSETRLHGRFREHRLFGEWFAWHPELEAMMASLNGARAPLLADIREGRTGNCFADNFADNGIASCG